jgi:hypothetical protein
MFQLARDDYLWRHHARSAGISDEHHDEPLAPPAAAAPATITDSWLAVYWRAKHASRCRHMLQRFRLVGVPMDTYKVRCATRAELAAHPLFAQRGAASKNDHSAIADGDGRSGDDDATTILLLDTLLATTHIAIWVSSYGDDGVDYGFASCTSFSLSPSDDPAGDTRWKRTTMQKLETTLANKLDSCGAAPESRPKSAGKFLDLVQIWTGVDRAVHDDGQAALARAPACWRASNTIPGQHRKPWEKDMAFVVVGATRVFMFWICYSRV